MKRYNKAEGQERRFLQKYLFIICTIVLGVTVSFALFGIMNYREQTNQQIEFESRAMGYSNSMQNHLNEYLGALQFVADFLNNSSQMNRQLFSSLVKNALSRYPGIQAFSWNPLIMDKEREIYESRASEEGLKDFKFTEKTKEGELIRAAQRREYVVVYYIDPIENNRAALGFDITSEQVRLHAITRVFNTGKLSATSRITLVQEFGNQYGVLILLPIYQQGASLNSLEERNKHRKGLVVEVLRIGEIVETALAGFSEEGINLCLYDVSYGEEQFLCSYPPHIPDMIDQTIEKNADKRGLHWSTNIGFADRKWKILFRTAPLYFDTQQSRHAWIVLLGSLLLTLTLAYYMYRRLSYTDEIENRINKQIETNKELEKEITERKRAEERMASLAHILEESLNEIYIFDAKTLRFIRANKGARLNLGYSMEELSLLTPLCVYNSWTLSL
jgi:CHASE1-domain containing sensor protein